MSTIVSVDVGGTYTDVSVLGDQGFTMAKVKTTRNAVDGVLQAVAEGLAAAGADSADVTQILHATTAATNAIFERTGARTAHLATEGFGDVVLIGREVRSGAERFQITLPKPHPFVEPESIYEVRERVKADGSVLVELDEDAVRRVGAAVWEAGHETLAVSLLHSYRNPTHEQRIGEILSETCPGLTVVLSSVVCPEPGEYERAMTTIVCAYIAPLIGRYLDELEDRLVSAGIDATLVIIGSDGAGIDAATLRQRPITSVESGPVAGVMAAKSLADELGIPTCVTLDIGGTTSKAGVVTDGRIELTKDFRVGGPLSAASRKSASVVPVRMPVVDMSEIGVGGGSIAWTDAAGMLRVGPDSAGADPGPACFLTGGTRATVTDAAVAVGLLAGRTIVGTDVPLDLEAATAALAEVGLGLHLDPVAAGVAVRGVASAEIAAAVQRQLFHRGIDPRRLSLFAFGGTGPLHGAEVAEIVGTPRVVVPRAAGVFTTFGLLSSEIGLEALAHTRIFVTGDGREVETVLVGLEGEVRQLLAGNRAPERLRIERSADVRFRHQVQPLSLNLPSRALSDAEVADYFRLEYTRQFGLTSGDDVEVVQLRVRGISAQDQRGRSHRSRWSLRAVGTKPVYFDAGTATAADHLELIEAAAGVSEVVGPAVVDLTHTSTTVPAGWRATVFGDGDLSLDRLER